MKPLYNSSQKILVSPLVYGSSIPLLNIKLPGLKKPERGDVLVLAKGRKSNFFVDILDNFLGFLSFRKISLATLTGDRNTKQYYVRRLVGLPGDTIKINNYNISIKPDQKEYFVSEKKIINRKYDIIKNSTSEDMSNTDPFFGSYDEIFLKKNEYLLAGDNRKVSFQSGYYIKTDISSFKGMVLFKYWPLQKK